jgi:hypothetical protein
MRPPNGLLAARHDTQLPGLITATDGTAENQDLTSSAEWMMRDRL